MITLISSPKQLIATTVHKFQEKGTPPPKKPRKAILLEELPDNTNIQLAKNEKGLFVDDSGFIHVYTDGACSKNGQLGKMVKKSFVSFYLGCKTTKVTSSYHLCVECFSQNQQLLLILYTLLNQMRVVKNIRHKDDRMKSLYN